MTIYKATVELYIDVENEAAACDAVSELLSCNLQAYVGAGSCFIDWRHIDPKASPCLATKEEIAAMEHEPIVQESFL